MAYTGRSFFQLGALIAAAFRAYTRPSGTMESPRADQPPWADFAIVNSGGIRAGLPGRVISDCHFAVQPNCLY